MKRSLVFFILITFNSLSFSQIRSLPTFMTSYEPNGSFEFWSKRPGVTERPYVWTLGNTQKVAIKVHRNVYLGLTADYSILRSNFMALHPLYGAGVFGRYYYFVEKKHKKLSKIIPYVELSGKYINYYYTDTSTISTNSLIKVPVVGIVVGGLYHVGSNFYINAGLRKQFNRPSFSKFMLALEYYF